MFDKEELVKPLGDKESGSGVSASAPSISATSNVTDLPTKGNSTMSTNKKGKEKVRNRASLIPLGDSYAEHGFNVLLIGLHGTGKTASVMDIAERMNLKMKYFSCSTLDPYTDLVGVPVPMGYCIPCKEYYHLSEKKCLSCKGHLVEALRSIRPREVDDADMIFFDEFNRADSKTTNAVFEIIQFKSINGEPLPNLKCCWAAINPPDNEYHVEEVDPALLDRFDVYIEIKPKPSVAYMQSQGIDISVAQALKQWWDEQDRKRRDFESYISPRRLEKIGHLFKATGNTQSIVDALPKSGKVDKNKLVYLLEVATGKRKEVSGNFGEAAASFNYEPGSLAVQKKQVIEYLSKNPEDLETHKKIAETLSKYAVGAETLIKIYGEILNNLKPAVLEGMLTGMSASKQSQMRRAFVDYKTANPKKAKVLDSLEDILSENSRILKKK